MPKDIDDLKKTENLNEFESKVYKIFLALIKGLYLISTNKNKMIYSYPFSGLPA